MLITIPNKEVLPVPVIEALEAMAAAISGSFEARHTADGVIARPLVRAYQNAPQSIPNATWTAVTFNAEEDIRSSPSALAVPGVHSTTTRPDRFMVPRNRSGLVKVTGTVAFDANATGSRGLALTADDVIVRCLEFRAAATAIGASVLSFAVEYVAEGGVALGIMAYQNSGGALTVSHTSREFQNEIQIEFA